jgi:hypothetical protein
VPHSSPIPPDYPPVSCICKGRERARSICLPATERRGGHHDFSFAYSHHLFMPLCPYHVTSLLRQMVEPLWPGMGKYFSKPDSLPRLSSYFRDSFSFVSEYVRPLRLKSTSYSAVPRRMLYLAGRDNTSCGLITSFSRPSLLVIRISSQEMVSRRSMPSAKSKYELRKRNICYESE